MTALHRRTLLAAAAALAAPGIAHAAYPDRPIRLIIPFPPGGTVDVTARIVAAKAGELLGGPMVIENLAGAGGNLAGQRVARSVPDGYTVLFTTPNHTINPSLFTNMGYDPERDLVPISLVAQIPEILISPVSAPFATFAEFVSHAKANPGRLSYSSAGIGSHPHVTMELLNRRLGLEIQHVPYRGAAPALTDLVAGRVQLKLDTYATSAPHLATNAIRVLATCGPQRLPQLPQVPTVAESGLPGFEGILWMGVVAPAGIPAEATATLARALREAVRAPDVLERLTGQGVEAVGSTPEAFRAIIAREIPQWREVIRAAGIRAE